jgi:cold shock CspA family protein
MPIGKLLIYNDAKGYGFITHGNGDKDAFVYVSELLKAGIEPSAKISLADLTLEYTIGFGRNNKKQATNIKVIDRGKYIK